MCAFTSLLQHARSQFFSAYCTVYLAWLSISLIQLQVPLHLLLILYWSFKTIIQKDTCTLVFIAALFTIAKIWKQLKCPSTDEYIKKMGCINIYTPTRNGVLLSYKIGWNNAICSNMDAIRDHHTKWRKPEREQ